MLLRRTVFEVLDQEEEAPDADGELATPVQGRVAFENVSFSYSPDKPLITDLNLVAEPGSTVAIVGPTGAGKTTLVNLILRFYDVQSGRITIDGTDITSIRGTTCAPRSAWCCRTPGCSVDDPRQHRLWPEGATEEEVLAAATATYVDRFVHSLPEGYDTMINDEASNLSAGEKQLVTIARAFLADPSILILDEATSSVDTRTEVLVQRAMKKLRSDRTSFVIAHRLSTIRDADVILVMGERRHRRAGRPRLAAGAKGLLRLYQSQFAAAPSRTRPESQRPVFVSLASRRDADTGGQVVRLPACPRPGASGRCPSAPASPAERCVTTTISVCWSRPPAAGATTGSTTRTTCCACCRSRNLKALGLSLTEIGEALAIRRSTPVGRWRSHLELLRGRIEAEQLLADRLHALAETSDRSWEDVLDAIALTRLQSHTDPILRLRAALVPEGRTDAELFAALDPKPIRACRRC